jgi:hypothetical protein
MRMTHGDFLKGVSEQMADFLKLIPFMKGDGRDRQNYTKRFYEYVTSHAELAETFLDSCGARENRAWFFLRELVAAIRCFAKVAYLLCYFELRVSWKYDPDEETVEFRMISSQVREIFDAMLQRAFVKLEEEVGNLGITIPQSELTKEHFPHFVVPGHLYAELWVEESSKEDEAIVKIATSYLEIAEEYTSLGFSRIFSQQELLDSVPERVNEERLRIFEADVHNLQSVYDTFIQYTRMEANDHRLIRLREYVATALHLLEMATVLVHFHERHERNSRHAEIYARLQKITGTYQILDVMGNFALFYCTRFLEKGKLLSEETVLDYAQIQSKRIPVPIYRGFHVRPSTYIAKIARHYGVDIQMHLGDEVYDAGCVFDLFRANEKINMEKRRLIAKKLVNAQHILPTRPAELIPVIKQELKYLIDERAIIEHQELLPEDMIISDLNRREMLTPEEVRGCINELITRLLALGKIDIIMPLSVTFIGDKRALEDIEILARTGYGEDARGNNIPMPAELSYLYRT